jgi:hypothetical protein
MVKRRFLNPLKGVSGVMKAGAPAADRMGSQFPAFNLKEEKSFSDR